MSETGPERDKASELEARMAAFEETLGGMRGLLVNLPDKTQAERAIAADRRLDGIGRQVRLGIILIAVLVVLAIYQGWDARQAAKEATKHRTEVLELAKDGITCLFEQLAEHRNANRAAHKAFSEALPAPYDVAAEDQPMIIPRELEAACAPFLAGARP